MARKSDLQQLKGILAQFSEEVIQEAVKESSEETYCQKSYRDFDDPGPEVEVGTESCVNLEEIAYLERIIAEPNLLPVHFLEEGAVVQRAVARVRVPGLGYGTGYLVSPSLFMTNNHVIPTVALARNAEVEFNYQLDYQGNPQTVDTYSPDPDDIFYTNASLDFTLVRLNPHCRSLPAMRVLTTGSPGGEFYENAGEYTPFPPGPFPPGPFPPDPILRAPYLGPRILPWVCTNPGEVWGYLQLSDTISYSVAPPPGQHVNIIQHPRKRRKEVAVQRNHLTNIYVNRVRYQTDTEPGSSGSPVFNNQWDLIAIHHAAGEKQNSVWISNEGMRIDKIVADLRNNYSGTTTGNQILAELGI